MKKIAVFASGSGTNAEAIMNYVEEYKSGSMRVELILSNNSSAFVLERAERHGVPTIVFTKQALYTTPQLVMSELEAHQIDFIVLAGFMLLVPAQIIERYRGRIVNIHPALLPSYGGQGMYGDRVHRAVIEAREKESGITIHLVDERYDEGGVLFQAKCHIVDGDTPETLAAKIHKLEHQHFPRIITQTIEKL